MTDAEGVPPQPDWYSLKAALRQLFDPAWYCERYADVRHLGGDVLDHFIQYGVAGGRDPNQYFDTAWYAARYPEIQQSGLWPLVHYLLFGAAEKRDPHPRFDSAYYIAAHPEAAANPLLYHLRVGASRGWPTCVPFVGGRVKYRYSIVACARWEAEAIAEWVAYHRSLGFDHIYLYCNDDDPSELYEKLAIDGLARDQFVTFRHFPFVGLQRNMYCHFLVHSAHETEWFVFLDIDEFISLRNACSIREFMLRYEASCDALYLNWIFFGHNGFVERPTGSVVLQYTLRDAHVNHYTKMVTRAAAVDIGRVLQEGEVGFWHDWGALGRHMRRRTVLGDPIADYYDDFPRRARAYLDHELRQQAILGTACIHHYAFRSENDLLRRQRRGTTGDFHGQRVFEQVLDDGTLANFLRQFNQVEDTTLRDYWLGVLVRGRQASVVPPTAGTNIALGKRATQSSVSQWAHGVTPGEDAARLVSGHWTGTYNNHTGLDTPAWWQVDLGERCAIGEIRIHNRIGPVAMMCRACRLEIGVSLEEDQWSTVFRKDDDALFGGTDGNPLIWKPPHELLARKVRVQLLGTQYLHLEQVEIFGAAVPARTWPSLDEEPPVSLQQDRIAIEAIHLSDGEPPARSPWLQRLHTFPHALEVGYGWRNWGYRSWRMRV